MGIGVRQRWSLTPIDLSGAPPPCKGHPGRKLMILQSGLPVMKPDMTCFVSEQFHMEGIGKSLTNNDKHDWHLIFR